jgi:uncharacterized protein (DUF58 family)
VLFPLVEPGRGERKSLLVALHGRGYQPLPALRVQSRFPVNFFVRWMTVAVTEPVLVFPAPRPCPAAAQADPTGRHGTLPNRRRGLEGEISRIGDYRGGEPLKLIHWKLSARHDQLKVKDLSTLAYTPVVIDLADLPVSPPEERLRCACWLVGQLLRAGRPVGLRVGETVIAPACGRAHKLRLLKALALYGRHQDAA